MLTHSHSHCCARLFGVCTAYSPILDWDLYSFNDRFWFIAFANRHFQFCICSNGPPSSHAHNVRHRFSSIRIDSFDTKWIGCWACGWSWSAFFYVFRARRNVGIWAFLNSSIAVSIHFTSVIRMNQFTRCTHVYHKTHKEWNGRIFARRLNKSHSLQFSKCTTSKNCQTVKKHRCRSQYRFAIRRFIAFHYYYFRFCEVLFFSSFRFRDSRHCRRRTERRREKKAPKTTLHFVQ